MYWSSSVVMPLDEWSNYLALSMKLDLCSRLDQCVLVVVMIGGRCSIINCWYYLNLLSYQLAQLIKYSYHQTTGNQVAIKVLHNIPVHAIVLSMMLTKHAKINHAIQASYSLEMTNHSAIIMRSGVCKVTAWKCHTLHSRIMMIG